MYVCFRYKCLEQVMIDSNIALIYRNVISFLSFTAEKKKCDL